jgi:hypothetical protein
VSAFALLSRCSALEVLLPESFLGGCSVGAPASGVSPVQACERGQVVTNAVTAQVNVRIKNISEIRSDHSPARARDIVSALNFRALRPRGEDKAPYICNA